MKIRLPLVTFALVALSIAVHLVPGAAEALQFDRLALARGEWWRLVTAHFTHFEMNHLVWDAGVLLVLGWAAEHESRTRCVQTLGVASVAITAAVWFWQPQFATYRGLSGLDSALFALLAASLLRRGDRAALVAGATALLAIGAKTVFEVATGSTVFAAGGTYSPVPLAHLIGLAAGLAVAFVPRGLFPSIAQRAITTGAG